jgi:hypothetical protein
MAHHLDPKLQRIIEDASGEVQPSGMDYSPAINVDFAQTALNRHLKRQQYRDEPSFLPTEFQTTRSLLDDFGMCSSFPLGHL